MALLARQDIALAGTVPTYNAAAGGGDTFPAQGRRTFLHVKNGGVGSINVTLNSLVNCNQGSDHDNVTPVGAGADKFIGPIDPDRFADPTGVCGVTYSGVTSVTVAVLQLPSV